MISYEDNTNWKAELSNFKYIKAVESGCTLIPPFKFFYSAHIENTGRK